MRLHAQLSIRRRRKSRSTAPATLTRKPKSPESAWWLVVVVVVVSRSVLLCVGFDDVTVWSGDDNGKERKRNDCLSSGTTRPARPTRVNSCLQEEKKLVGWAVQSHLRAGRRKRSIGLFAVLAAVVLVHCCVVLSAWCVCVYVLVRMGAGRSARLLEIFNPVDRFLGQLQGQIRHEKEYGAADQESESRMYSGQNVEQTWPSPGCI